MFKPTAPPTPEEAREIISGMLLDLTTTLEPIYDFAEGMRRDLESRGWSPTAAESASLAWLAAQLAAIGGAGR